MDRVGAIVLTIIVIIIITIIAYYKAQLTWYSALILGLLLGLVILNIAYPATQAVRDQADWSLIVYGILQCVTVISIIIYLLYVTLQDRREPV
jgi:Kef-type K+ transport system membrane component KefB